MEATSEVAKRAGVGAALGMAAGAVDGDGSAGKIQELLENEAPEDIHLIDGNGERLGP